jgi:hypothetical protein
LSLNDLARVLVAVRAIAGTVPTGTSTSDTLAHIVAGFAAHAPSEHGEWLFTSTVELFEQFQSPASAGRKLGSSATLIGALRVLQWWLAASGDNVGRGVRRLCPRVFVQASLCLPPPSCASIEGSSGGSDLALVLLGAVRAFSLGGADLSAFNCGVVLQTLAAAGSVPHSAHTAMAGEYETLAVLMALVKRHLPGTTLCAPAFFGVTRPLLSRFLASGVPFSPILRCAHVAAFSARAPRKKCRRLSA